MLDHSNYHTLKNRYLTNSRMNDWKKCKRFFYERHISGERPGATVTDEMKVGKGVDTLVFYGKDEFLKNFIAVSRRSKKNPPQDITELTESQFNDCLGMAEVMKRQPMMIDCESHEKQKIITMDMPIGEHFCGLSAIPDIIDIKGDTCILTDLKTTADANERKHHWKSIDFGYYSQFAVMTIILRKSNPEIKNFVYRHAIIQKDKDSIFEPFAYYLDNERIELFVEDILDNIVPAIAAEKDFKPKEVSWDTAVVIGSLNKDDEF